MSALKMEPTIQFKFEQYPAQVKPALMALRTLILTTAQELNLGKVEETLKWGEPSYNVKSGSAIRFDWKAKTPEHYYLFFNCQTKLVDTFSELYNDVLEFQGNRAIVLSLKEPIEETAIKQCLTLALTYQNIKHLPLLGV